MQNKKIIPIVVSSDDNYAPLVSTVIISICSNTNNFCKFFVLDGGINEKNIKKINFIKSLYSNLDIEFIKIDVNTIFKDVAVKNNLSLSAFNRLLIPQLIKNYSKLLYLDVDIIALGDIKELYDIDLEEYIIGAVPDSGMLLEGGRETETCIKVKKFLELDEDSIYFNSGVMLIDCDKWKQNVKMEELLTIEKKYRDVRLYNDQDVLNKYFNKNYKILDQKYNVIFNHNNNIKLRHFADRIKPWCFPKGSYNNIYNNLDDFWEYAEISPFYEFFTSKISNKLLQSHLIATYLTKQINKLKTQDVSTIKNAIELNFLSALEISKDLEKNSGIYIEKITNILKLSFLTNDKDVRLNIPLLMQKLYASAQNKDLLKKTIVESKIKPIFMLLENKNQEGFINDLIQCQSFDKFILKQLFNNVNRDMKRQR